MRPGRSAVFTFVLAALPAAILIAEGRRPLRRRHHARHGRWTRNALWALAGGVTILALEDPVVRPIARLNEQTGRGLSSPSRLPTWLRRTMGVLALDYTLFVWHYLTHKVPPLWWAHAFHHEDPDMDASTAFRFHVVELAMAVPWRALQVRALGVDEHAFTIWRQLTVLSIMFHHANVRLPPAIERPLSRWLATPRLHDIHHSTRAAERNSNWSSGLALWDRLHGTWRSVERARQGAIGLDD